mmetsp:Transcript_24513/g.78798  ORF Transcript_24513/g.78798 Transcript_24513/m.78798 type:complete len:237 (-) Transcript_24513:2887-3597(-)
MARRLQPRATAAAMRCSSCSDVRERGTHITHSPRAVKWKGSRRWRGSSHRMPAACRSDEKSSGLRSPKGQLSSARSGCRMRSTSSRIRTPRWKSDITSQQSPTCLRDLEAAPPPPCAAGLPKKPLAHDCAPKKPEPSRVAVCASLLYWFESSCIRCRKARANDLSAFGVEQTSPPCPSASRSLRTSCGVTAVVRSKEKVYTALGTNEEKRSRSTPCVKVSSVAGTTCMRSCEPSAK